MDALTNVLRPTANKPEAHENVTFNNTIRTIHLIVQGSVRKRTKNDLRTRPMNELGSISNETFAVLGKPATINKFKPLFLK